MDASRFDRLSKALAGAGTRRGFVQIAAGLAAAALPLLPDDADAAKRRSQRGGRQRGAPDNPPQPLVRLASPIRPLRL